MHAAVFLFGIVGVILAIGGVIFAIGLMLQGIDE